MRRTGPDQATAQLVVARNLGMCLRCNQRPGSQIHHRIPRGMGGTRNPIVNTAPALVWICQPCHAEIESYRQTAYVDGWLVRRGADPATTPLVNLLRDVLMLLPDGSVITDAGDIPEWTYL